MYIYIHLTNHVMCYMKPPPFWSSTSVLWHDISKIFDSITESWLSFPWLSFVHSASDRACTNTHSHVGVPSCCVLGCSKLWCSRVFHVVVFSGAPSCGVLGCSFLLCSRVFHVVVFSPPPQCCGFMSRLAELKWLATVSAIHSGNKCMSCWLSARCMG